MKEGTDLMSRSPQTHSAHGAFRGGSAWLAVVAFLVVTGIARWSAAQDPAVIDKLVQLNKKAMDDFDTADFDAAKKSLLDAEKLGKRAGLESHPVMARTYIHLGAVFLSGYRDKQKAQHYFEKALDIQSDIHLDKNMTSPALRDAFAATVAKRTAGGGGEDMFAPPPPGGGRKGRGRPEPETAAVPPEAESDTESGAASGKRRRGSSRDEGGGGGEPDLPAKVEALDCPHPSDTSPGKKLTLRCAAAESLGVANVNLYYKGFEMQDYESIPMEKSPKGWWQAQVPKKHVDGKSLQFYFEGVDASDKPVVSNGRAESPNVMLIVNKSLPRPKKRKEEEDPFAEDIDFVGRKFGNRKFWIGLGVGTGAVYTFNGTPEAAVNSYEDMSRSPPVSGIGWAGLLPHLAPTIGY